MANEARAKPAKEMTRATQIRLADLCRAYYIDGRSKIEIASDFGLSRFQVAKLLDDARASGVVTITIRDPRSRASRFDSVLADALGISRVRVVDDADDRNPEARDTNDAEALGLAAMDLLAELIRPRMVLGISWSRSLDLASRFLPDLPACDIVQLAGALQLIGSNFLPRVIALLGNSEGIRTYPISAPLVVDEKATALDLMRQPEIAEALSRADHLDLAIVAIGAWKAGESTVWEKVSEADRAAGFAAGAVGEISGRLLAADGKPISTGLDDRTIGVRIDQLVNAPQVIAVAHGPGRVDAVLAACKADIVTCLVIDSSLARALLDRLEIEHPPLD